MAINLVNDNISTIEIQGKKYNIRTAPFHGTAEEWLNSNHIPKDGELVIYDIDENCNYKRIKIGDGKTLINDLPFITDELADNVAYINVEDNENINNPNIEPTTLEIDSALSQTSVNPVQNKVITEKITELSEGLAEHTHTIESIEGLQDAVNSAADSKFYVVTFEQGDDNKYHADLTFAEIREKFEAGGNMVARIDGTDYIPLLSASPSQIIFSGIYKAQSVSLTIDSRETCVLTTTQLAYSSHTHTNASTTGSGFMSKEDKVKLNEIEELLDDVVAAKADWSQNDETAIDYIKNRPFYDNSITLLETITVNNGDTIDISVEDIGAEGDVVTVVWDGIASEQTIDSCKFIFGSFEIFAYTIGNQSYLNDSENTFEDTGEGYLLKSNEATSEAIIYCDDNPHTLSIIKGELIQIDEKFIPNAIARTDYVDEKINDAIADSSVSEAKLPITLGAFQYNKWGNLQGDTIEEQAQYLARFDVIVYQGALSDRLTMSGTDYSRDLALYTKALEYNPDLKVFGYVTARGFANSTSGGYVGMTEYRTSPDNVDHPIWTKEELCAYIKLMAHCGGTKDTSTTDEYGNSVLTGGIPLYGVFFDDYDYNFENDNTHLMNQGDWSSIREKHNFLIDYAHSCGLKVMPNSNPTLIFDNEPTTDSIRNPNGETSHMGEDDWFCLESYFLRSDYTFNTNYDLAYIYNTQYRETYNSKCLALTYIYAVSDDDEDNQKIASTFAIYQALCQGVDSIALHGTNFIAEIPDELSKYYDKNNNAVYSKGEDYYRLTVNGCTVTASRSVANTAYGKEPNAAALATCKVNVDGHIFNNIFVTNEELTYNVSNLEDSVNVKIEDLTNYVDNIAPSIGDNGNLFIGENDTGISKNSSGGTTVSVQSDWNQNDETASDYIKNKPFYEQDEIALETTTVNNGDANIAFDLVYYEPGQILTVVWDGVSEEKEVGYCRIDGSSYCTIGNKSYLNNDSITFEDTGEEYVIYAKTSGGLVFEKSSIKCDNNPHTLSITKYTLLEIDDKFIPDTIARASDLPDVDSKIAANINHRLLIDDWETENGYQKTWYTNYAPSMSNWKCHQSDWVAGATNENITFTIDEDGDGVTIDYLTADSSKTIAEYGIDIPANPDVMNVGETWEVGIKEFRAWDDDGNDVTNKCQLWFTTSHELGFNYYNKSSSFYNNTSISTLHSSLRNMNQATITTEGGMPALKLLVKALNFEGGTIREDGTHNCYHIYIKGFYIHNVAEKDEITIFRGYDPSDTYITLNRVTADKANKDLKPDALYVVDDGSMFITNFKGERIDINVGNSNNNTEDNNENNNEDNSVSDDNLNVTLTDDELTKLNSTITSLQALKKANTSIVAFLADLHIADWNVTNTENIKKTVHSYNMISSAVKTDLMLLGGDYLDNSTATSKEMALDWYSDLRNIISCRNTEPPMAVIKGNHDDNTMYTDYANGLVDFETFWTALGDIDDDRTIRNGGNIEDCYGYYDIPNQKVRVFYVNTVDIPQKLYTPLNKLNYRGQWDTGISVEQLQFIADNLKFDTAGWHVMVFSHHPIQYDISLASGCGVTATRGGAALLELLDKFNTGNTSGSISVTAEDFEGTVTYDFTSNEDCKVVACINGHTHRDSVDIYNDSFYCISTRAVADNISAYFVVDRNDYKLHLVYNGDGAENVFNYNSLITGEEETAEPVYEEIASPYTFGINNLNYDTGEPVYNSQELWVVSEEICGFTKPAIIDLSGYNCMYMAVWFDNEGNYVDTSGGWIDKAKPLEVPVGQMVRIFARNADWSAWTEEKVAAFTSAINVHVGIGGQVYFHQNIILPDEPDEPTIELGKPLENVKYVIGGSVSSGPKGYDVYTNAPRMTALATYGVKPLADINNVVSEDVYFIEIPADATKITVTCPGFIFGLQFFEYVNDTYNRLADPGWATLGVGSATFEAGAYTHVGINYKNSSNANIPTDTDTSGFSIVFE